MTLTTVFLGVLILSLLIGNALLFLIDKRGGRQKAIMASIASSPNPGSFSAVTQPQEQDFPQNKSLIPIETKIDLAHRRIQQLEEQIRASKSNGNNYSDEAMKRKIEKLDGFRSIAESELIAIKEILEELQNKNVTVKSRVHKGKKKAGDVSEERLHKMVFRSNS